ncbi:MAG: hypothetical protein BWK78_05980 [Thiotrichaceae bacterium IS1]|nr:MAG: hypothetical protein BWK78_05980 [Thiotrichaceae bacterium IS1]
MADYLSIPLSAVPADWFETQAKVQLQQLFSSTLKAGGILYLGVASDEEGSFLLSRISRLEPHPWQQFKELQMEWSDPYLFWEQMVGNAEEMGIVSPNSLVLVEGGCFLPLEFLKLRANWLVNCAKAHHWIIALPVLNRHFSRLKMTVDAIGTLKVPPLQTYLSKERKDKERKEIIKQLVQQSAPSLEEEIQQYLVKELLDANPTSRTLLQNWINFYTSQEDCLQTLNEEPPPPRLKGRPVIVPPTRQELKARFDTAQAKLNQANRLFKDWLSYPLIHEFEPLGDPFGSAEPSHWFTMVVSILYCHLIEKEADFAFAPMTKYKVEDGKIKSIEKPLFYKTVGRLRTTMQHGLTVGEEGDSDTMQWVKSWYFEKIEESSPKRHHWRILTDSLIQEYDQAVSQLLQAVELLCTCDPRDALAVRTNLERHRRKLGKHTWRKIVENTIKELDAKLDAEKFLNTNHNDFCKQLDTSLPDSASLQDKACEIVKEFVWRKISEIQKDDLIKIGFSRGPLLGEAQKYGNEEWEKSPHLTKEKVLELVKTKYYPKDG